MIIEDQDAFKAWLTAVLEPLCDADPAALAKYVFALVKKDKPVPDLRASMVEQLDVFLQAETKNFVELLFRTLETQEYVLPAVAAVTNSVESPKQQSVALITPKVTDGFPQSTTVAEVAPSITQSSLDKEEKPPRSSRSKHRSSLSPVRGCSRSRSWERSRRTRSRDREPRRERDRSRPWRNKSPPGRRYERRRSWSRSDSPPVRSRSRSPRYSHRGTRYRNRSPPPPRTSHSRSRSRSADRKKEPLSGAATPTQDSNHGDVDMRLTTTSQSIQSVVSAGGKEQPASAPALLSSIFHNKRRCRDFDEKGYCMRGDLCPYDHGNDPVVLEDVALSRVLAFGPTVPPPAPPPPPAPEPPLPPPLETPHVMHHPPPHQHMRGPHPGSLEYNPDAPSMEPRMGWGRAPFRGPPPGMRGGMMRGGVGRPMAYNPQPQRELISVPVTDQAQQNYQFKRMRQPENSSTSNGNNTTVEAKDSAPPKKKSAFDFTRLGPRHKNPNNCSLELKKVPRGMNNITHLNNHFAKFGKIVNIQVCYEGDPEAAIITFSSHAEANAAYRSTEAVLNNRFIKVFWHNANHEGKQENVPPPRPSVKERLGVPNPISSNKVLNTLQPKAQESIEKVIMSGNNLTKTVYIPTALKKQENPTVVPAATHETTRAHAAAVIKKSQEILAAKETLKKKQEEKRKEAMKLTADLRKRKQELLDKHLSEQKALIERLEKGGVAPEQREPLMATIKSLQESIERIRKDLATVVATNVNTAAKTKPTSSLVKKSKEEAQREMLDAELDLFTRQQEGGDTAELQRKVNELRIELHSLGLLAAAPVHARPTRGLTHGRRGLHHRGGSMRVTRSSVAFRGRGRAFAHHVSVDHRPTKVLVSGYEEDEKTEVLAHFAHYGEIVDYIADESTPSLILNYKSRKEAELAMMKGRTFQDRLLSITWCSATTARAGHGIHLPHRAVLMMGAGAEGQEAVEEQDDGVVEEEEEVAVADITEDVLLQDDEEEEEDGEDRSWRR